MASEALADQGPPAELRFRRRIRPVRATRELWRARELVRSLAERDLRARYKQAVLGLAWAVITPLVLMVVFTVVFTRIAQVDTGGVPYPLFSYLGLLPWAFFMTSVSQGANSLISNVNLLNKVYCPREVFPIATVIVAGVDMLVSTGVLLVLFAVNSFMPHPTSVFVPILLLIQVAFTLGVTMVLSAVVVYLRDVRHALPILLQMGLFATPVAYALTAVPEQWQVPYVIVNPLGAVIDGYRRAVLMGTPPDATLTAAAGASAFVVLMLGFLLFKKLETGIADVA
jgi:ABC-2 type transport system permease protein/lipopolysaccharide transport system permease protein